MPVGGVDIVSVTYATEGTTTTKKVRGKTVKTYEPAKLLVTLKLAEAPIEQAGIKYKVESEVEGCGTFSFAYAPGTVYSGLLGPSSLYVGCGGADPVGGEGQIIFPKMAVNGSSIVWTVSLKTLPKNVRAGARLSGLNATVDLVEPVLGVQGLEESGGPALIDTATSDAEWVIG